MPPKTDSFIGSPRTQGEVTCDDASVDPQGKTVIVTGASSGIGEAAARAFFAAGSNVVLAARNRVKLEAIVAELGQDRALAVTADVTNRDQVAGMIDAALARFGRLDIIVNNAGVGLRAPIDTVDPADFERLFQVNLMGPLLAMQAGIRAMRKTGGGMIVNISSGTSRIVVPFLGGAYPALKRALEIMSDYARAQLAPENINVLVVLPYLTTTPFGANALGQAPGPPPPEFAARLRDLPPAHTAEFVAEKILEGVRGNLTEVSLSPQYPSR